MTRAPFEAKRSTGLIFLRTVTRQSEILVHVMEIETFEVSLQVNLLSSEGAERVEALVRPTDAPAWCIALGRRKRKRGTSGTLWCRENCREGILLGYGRH